MSELIVKYPDRAPDHFPLGRLRITIGRSARNDLCIPDPFASRVHAEVRREGDEYVLQDLGSANGTLYNGATVEGARTQPEEIVTTTVTPKAKQGDLLALISKVGVTLLSSDTLNETLEQIV